VAERQRGSVNGEKGAPTSRGGREVRVALGARAYSVVVEAGALERIGAIVTGLLPDIRRAFVVVDEGLPAQTTARATASLEQAGLAASTRTIRPSEHGKSLQTLGGLLAELTRLKHERREPVIALGGGIVGDVAGFAAGVYRRGVPVVQCPTTLLAMVDASVGGKTGINIDVGGAGGGAPGREDLKKNMAGVFHQPVTVVADVSVLSSLPDRHFRSGLAECVKHALVGADWGEPGLWDWTLANLGPILAREPGTLVELVARNVSVKAAVVKSDEREEADSATGGRALLNLGHTFAHAIETIPHLSPDGDARNAPLQHGEAVALGLVAACRAAELMNPALKRDRLGEVVVAALEKIGLPTRIAGLPPTERVVEAMGHDKKVSGGLLRLVLPSSLGRARVVESPPPSAVTGAIDSIRA
jgi:3-dehydroquinate synthetase